MTRLKHLLVDDDGATAVEYAVLLAMVLLACFTTIAFLGTETSALWSNNQTGLQQVWTAAGN